MVCALILSRVDTCNILYYGVSAENMGKLQWVQNSAARLAWKVSSHDGVKSEDLLHKLHWLRIRERVVYKVLVTVHKCVYGNAPVNVQSLVRLSQSSRLKALEVRGCRSSYGERAFSVCGPRLWNCLPSKLRLVDELECFKNDLKTYLFRHGQDLYNLIHMK